MPVVSRGAKAPLQVLARGAQQLELAQLTLQPLAKYHTVGAGVMTLTMAGCRHHPLTTFKSV